MATKGRNTVTGQAFAKAFEQDLERTLGVQHARAQFLLTENVIRLQLDVCESSPPQEIIAHVRRAADRVTVVAEFQSVPRLETDIRLVKKDLS
jgi:hypothetical protein